MDNAFVHIGTDGKWTGKETRYLRGVPGYCRSATAFCRDANDESKRKESSSSHSALSPFSLLSSFPAAMFENLYTSGGRMSTSFSSYRSLNSSAYRFCSLSRSPSRHHLRPLPAPADIPNSLRHVERNTSGEVPDSR